MKMRTFFYIFMGCVLLSASCEKVIPPCKKEKQGTLELRFTQTVDEQPIQLNKLIYTNTAGNKYQINDIKYFISRLCLNDNKGESFEVKQDNGIHYVDDTIPNTWRWRIDHIPSGDYVSLSFVFGLDENDNISNRFPNPPECNFAWPDPLGGGYHYMQINGKFLSSENLLKSLTIHTGIGQIREDENVITQFVHNHFKVTLPVLFSIYENNSTPLTLNMEIQRWFDTPNLYDFSLFGSGIMQNQQAQELLKQNGWNVFEISPP